jgi:hypothetical protein
MMSYCASSLASIRHNVSTTRSVPAAHSPVHTACPPMFIITGVCFRQSMFDDKEWRPSSGPSIASALPEEGRNCIQSSCSCWQLSSPRRFDTIQLWYLAGHDAVGVRRLAIAFGDVKALPFIPLMRSLSVGILMGAYYRAALFLLVVAATFLAVLSVWISSGGIDRQNDHVLVHHWSS